MCFKRFGRHRLQHYVSNLIFVSAVVSFSHESIMELFIQFYVFRLYLDCFVVIIDCFIITYLSSLYKQRKTGSCCWGLRRHYYVCQGPQFGSRIRIAP